MNINEKIHIFDLKPFQIKKLSFIHKQNFKLLSKNKTGAFNVKYIQHRDGSARLAGINHMIFSN